MLKYIFIQEGSNKFGTIFFIFYKKKKKKFQINFAQIMNFN